METPDTRAFSVEESVFTIDEAAHFLRISRSFFYQLIADKKISTGKIGARTIVHGSELSPYAKAATGTV